MIEEKLKEIEIFLRGKKFTDKAVKTYISCLRRVFINLGLKFTQKQLEDYLNRKKITGRTYNNYRAICNFYTKKYLNYEITFTKAKVPTTLATIITEKEFYQMLNATSNFKHKLLLSFMYRSGLRVSEAVKVKEQDVDLDNLTLFVRSGKGNKDRVTIIPKSFAYYLSLHIKTIKDYLFPTYRGHLSEKSAQETLKKAIRKAGIRKRVKCHDLRKNFAINLANKKIPINKIRKMLGHIKLTTTQGYVEYLEDDLTAIAQEL